ncbi:MAG TPA: hypothetical protein VMW52_07010 [Phycisphaerae bacterium]|nr:hypothetical protein [Phycisphaerae bacterium]
MADNWQRSGVEYVVKDSTLAGTKGVTSNLARLDKASRGLGRVMGALGIGAGIYGVTRFFTSAAEAAMQQDEAEQALQATLGGSIAKYKDYAAEIQNRTRYGDEAVLAEIAYGKNLGITADRLEAATTAAIGLAAKYKIDLHSAMMLVGRASMGQTQMLTRYGIVLDETLTDQQKFNALLRMGAGSFGLAEAAAESLSGRAEQLKNRWGDLKETLGAPIAEAAVSSLEKLAQALEDVQGFRAKLAASGPFAGLTKEQTLSMRRATGVDPGLGNMGYDYYAQPEPVLAANARPPAMIPGAEYRAAQLGPRGLQEAVTPEAEAAAAAAPAENYTERVRAAYQRSAEAQARIAAQITAQIEANQVNTEGAMAGPVHWDSGTPIDYAQAYKDVTKAAAEWGKEETKLAADLAKSKDAVASMDTELEFSIEIADRMAAGHAYAADQVDYERAVWAAYGNDIAGATEKIEAHRQGLETLEEKQKDLARGPLLEWSDVARKGLEDLSATLTDIALDFENAGQYAERFAEQLAALAIQEMVMKPLVQGVATAFSSSAEPKHRGGIVGTGPVEPVAFHAGGLASDEVLAKLLKREVVLTERDADRLRRMGILNSRGKPSFHTGGTVGGPEAASVAPMGRGERPNVSIKIDNQTGAAVAEPDVGVEFDLDEYIINAVLRDVGQGGRTRDLMRGGG